LFEQRMFLLNRRVLQCAAVHQVCSAGRRLLAEELKGNNCEKKDAG